MISGVATKEGVKIEINRVIRVKRERVFQAWTKPEMMSQWMGPKYLTCNSVQVDLRVGGAYRMEMHGQRPGEDGEMVEVNSVATGVFREIVPNEKLSMTWQGSWDPGEDSLVTVRLKDVEGGTEVSLVHDRFTAGKDVSGYRQGWTDALDKMATLYAA